MAKRLADLRKLQRTQLKQVSEDELTDSILASREEEDILADVTHTAFC